MFTKRIPLKYRFERFFQRADTTQCWNWAGAPNSAGYGTIRMPGRHGKTVTAHRLAYVFEHGPVPDGLCVCHHCDNRLCVNPSHLFVGTNADNVRDRDGKGRCKSRGLPGERCGRSKLKETEVLSIISDPRNCTRIAKDYRVARTTISRIKSGRAWGHLRTIGKWKEK